jgi:hypothetical protein
MKKTEQKEKLITLSRGELTELMDLVIRIGDIKYDIELLEEQEKISSIMFKMGSIYQQLDKIENDFENILLPLDESEEE